MYKFNIFFCINIEILYLLGFSGCGVAGRAINISSAWFLPQEGFPVFYRYFNDKISWNEAEAVCGFHHADLLSVQTNSQMDAARAYLKELDVTDNVWIGLQKDSPENPFSWTNGEKLLGDGYWTEPIPKTNEKLCAAIDPVADFRWNSYYCRGPEVASFVCELPVPEWAKKENGCLITSLPSLTITLLPEAGVIQLLSDCGLDGTRRIACNGATNREEIIKRLSCDVDAFTSKSTTDDAIRESSKPDDGSSLPPQTRHRRSPNPTTNIPIGEKTTSASRNSSIVPPHGFPHSPYLASVRNAPSTSRPIAATEPTKTIPPPVLSTPTNETKILLKDVPVLIITGEKSNETSSATSENPPLVLMIENKDLDEPFVVPLSDDIFINNPSLSPVEVINVDLVEVDNFTANSTTYQTTPENLPEANRRGVQSTSSQPETEDLLNGVQGEDKGVEIPQKPNRGRLLTHSSHPSFYPRFLNRVLGGKLE